jgi:hypothetical protein
MPTTFDFSSQVSSAGNPDNNQSHTAYQTVDGHTLQLTGDRGGWAVVDENAYVGSDVGALHGAALFNGVGDLASTLRLSLNSGSIFDLTSLNLWDQDARPGMQFRLTTSKGSVDTWSTDGQGGLAFTNYSPLLQGVSWVDITMTDPSQPFSPAVDDIVLSNIDRVPSFDAFDFRLAVQQNDGAVDLASLLRVTDIDSGQTLTWTQASAPAHGTLTLTDATAAAGDYDTAPGGTLTYRPAAGYAGTDSFTVRVSDGLASTTQVVTVNVAPAQPGVPQMDAGDDTGPAGDNVTAANSMTFTGTSAAGDNSSSVRVFVDVDGDGSFDAGEANGTATVADGSWRVANIDTSGVASGTYGVRAIVTSASGNLSSAASEPLAIRIDHTPPATTAGAIALSADSGSSAGDGLTNSAAQTITAVLSAPLAAGDRLLGSIDGGHEWIDLTAMAAGTTLTWTGATLVAGGGIALRVDDENGNQGVTATRAYTLDALAPSQGVATIALSADSGASASDFVTRVAAQTVSGTLSAPVTGGDIVEVSLDDGAHWSQAQNSSGNKDWSLAGQTLSGSGTLQVRVTDGAGNHGPTLSQDYTIDAVAPVAAQPVRANVVNPGGGFTFAVSYTDAGGAGLDPASFGTGNVTVRKGAVTLNVSGYTVANGTVTYTVDAPAGGWNAAALGDYTIGINGGAVRDLAGNAVAADANALTFHVGVAPSVTLTVADTTLTAGETTTVTIVFAEPGTRGLDLADLAVAHGSLSGLTSAGDGRTWTATLTPAAGVWSAANTVTLDMTGVLSADGTGIAGRVQSNAYAVHTGTPPAPPAPTSNATMDGVPVLSLTGIDPGTGFQVHTITVPTLTAPRAPGDLADIVLGAATGSAKGSLTVGLPVGAGLQVSGPAALLTHDQALLDLGQRMDQAVALAASKDYLASLAQGTLLQTATLVASGTSALTLAIAGKGAASAIVIDARQLGAASTIVLDDVGFASIVGHATLRGGAGNNYVIGDDASQSLYLGAGDDVLLGGGGNDVVGSAGGNDKLDGGAGNDVVIGGVGNDSVAGGSGDDVLQGGRSDRGAWTFMLDGNGVVTARHETATFAPGQHENVTLAEIDQDGAGLGFLHASAAALTDIALLYQAAFGRAPDLDGLNFYLQGGAQPLSIAHGFTTSAEWRETGLERLDNAAFVRQMYEQVLGRQPDTPGFAFWLAQLDGAGGHIATRAEVLAGFALSEEARALHKGGIAIGAGSVAQESGWFAGGGDDRLAGGAGNDVLVGGDGTDTAVFEGKRADAKVTLAADGTVHVVTATGSDTLHGIERGEFSDGTVDLRFTQASAHTLTTVGLLYQAVLDRAGDAAGLASWAAQDLPMGQLAAGFAGSAEFQARYGALDDAAFVRTLYANSGLATTAAGSPDAWVDFLQTHSRAELVGAWVAQEAVHDAQFATGGLWLV